MNAPITPPGRIGTTFRDSEPWWEVRVPPPGNPPNILQIVFDDTGWSDFGCFGSEIATPNIDVVAQQGLRYTNFHVTPLCSPTRACLFTGRNHHRVGMRFLADIDTGFPNSRGRIDPALPMLPAQLAAVGYGTYLIGKWHLTPQHEITAGGPFGHWPLARGFDRFFGFLDGCTDQFNPEMFEDNHFVETPLPDGKHLSTELADRAIRMLSDHVLYRPNDPFYLTFAPGATHAPLQAPRELIEKYVPIFEKGWDETRSDRLVKQIEMGLAPAGTQLTERNPGVPAWHDLDADERRLFVRQQAAFAAFLEHADIEIGRILERLEALGLRQDTLIVITADNGASREGGRLGATDVNATYSGVFEPVSAQLQRIDAIGGPDGPAHYPEGWAMAGNTPFRRYKQSVDLGGIRSPLIVAWPNGIADSGSIRTQFAHVIDIAATVSDLAGVRGRVAMDGESLRNCFASASAPSPRTTQYWEMFGHRAVWQDGWKAVTEHKAGTSYDDDVWRLYDTKSDFAENRDVAGENPELLDEMVRTWWREAESNDVLPLDDRTLVELLNSTITPHQLANRQRLVLRPENTHVPICTGVAAVDRTMVLAFDIRDRAAGEGGVLVASGARQGGYVLYIRDDELIFEYLALGRRSRVSGTIPAGSSTLTLGWKRHDDGATVTLMQNSRLVANGEVQLAVRHPSFWGLDIGRAPAAPFTGGYADRPLLRQGVLQTVTLDFREAMTTEDLADLIGQAE